MPEEKDFSIAIPTRNRPGELKNILGDIQNTVGEKLKVIVIHDNTDTRQSVEYTKGLNWVNTIDLPVKHSIAQLFNLCIIFSPTDYVIIPNDDARLNPGWFEAVLNVFNKDSNIKLLCLCEFHCFVIHKSLILDIGWFDENFTAAGQDDIDIVFRIAENGCYPVYTIRFASHGAAGSSHVQPNVEYFKEKWEFVEITSGAGRNKRKLPEIDWHPLYTKKYEEKFSYKRKEWSTFKEFFDVWIKYYKPWI